MLLLRKKLALLNEELKWIETFSRVWESRTDAKEDEHEIYVARQQRRSQILAEIVRLGGETAEVTGRLG
jgi:hypothetical protein